MNILPKKRWHVRTKDNVARVRRDEAQAAAEEKSRVERANLAEQEARTRLLRERAASKRSNDEKNVVSFGQGEKTQGDDGHVNFFAELEEQERTFGVNKEYEKEKRQEKETEEKKIGLLKYLGEGSTEYTKETPWYQKIPENRQKNEEKEKPTDFTPKLQKTNREIIFPSDISPKKRKKSKKRDKKSKKRRRSSSESSDEECEKSSERINLEKLRADRLRRENEEKSKTDRFLRQIRSEKEEIAQKSEPEYEQKYNSQFFPQLARQNRL